MMDNEAQLNLLRAQNFLLQQIFAAQIRSIEQNVALTRALENVCRNAQESSLSSTVVNESAADVNIVNNLSRNLISDKSSRCQDEEVNNIEASPYREISNSYHVPSQLTISRCVLATNKFMEGLVSHNSDNSSLNTETARRFLQHDTSPLGNSFSESVHGRLNAKDSLKPSVLLPFVFSKKNRISKIVSGEDLSENCDNDLDANCKPSAATHAEENANKGEHQCMLCGKIMRNSSSLAAHMSKSHKQTLGSACYRCHICGCVGSTRASLKRHLLRSHNTDISPQLMLKCPHCKEHVGSSRDQVNVHVREKHSDKLVNYKRCGLCSSYFSTASAYRRHLQRNHPHDYKGEIFKCEHCDKSLYTFSQYKHHLRAVHEISFKPPVLNKRKKRRKASGEGEDQKSFDSNGDQNPRDVSSDSNVSDMTKAESYKKNKIERRKQTSDAFVAVVSRKQPKGNCTVCGRAYMTAKGLRRHLTLKHSGEVSVKLMDYPCHLCDRVLPSSRARLRHLRTQHGEQTRMRCTVCHLDFPSVQEFKEHKQQHVFKCNYCSKSLVGRDSYREHLLIHTGRRLACPHCPKLFTQSSNLRRHIRIHTGEKPYSCPHCPRRFSDKSACKSHSRVHRLADKFACKQCSVTFTTPHKLRYHMRLHNGQGIHCPLCPYYTTNAYTLRKHLETHESPVAGVLVKAGLVSWLEDVPELVKCSLLQLAHSAPDETVVNKAEPSVKVKMDSSSQCVSNNDEAAETNEKDSASKIRFCDDDKEILGQKLVCADKRIKMENCIEAAATENGKVLVKPLSEVSVVSQSGTIEFNESACEEEINKCVAKDKNKKDNVQKVMENKMNENSLYEEKIRDVLLSEVERVTAVYIARRRRASREGKSPKRSLTGLKSLMRVSSESAEKLARIIVQNRWEASVNKTNEHQYGGEMFECLQTIMSEDDVARDIKNEPSAQSYNVALEGDADEVYNKLMEEEGDPLAVDSEKC